MKKFITIFLLVYLITGELIVKLYVKDAFLAYNIGLLLMAILFITVAILLGFKKKGG